MFFMLIIQIKCQCLQFTSILFIFHAILCPCSSLFIYQTNVYTSYLSTRPNYYLSFYSLWVQHVFIRPTSVNELPTSLLLVSIRPTCLYPPYLSLSVLLVYLSYFSLSTLLASIIPTYLYPSYLSLSVLIVSVRPPFDV